MACQRAVIGGDAHVLFVVEILEDGGGFV